MTRPSDTNLDSEQSPQASSRAGHATIVDPSVILSRTPLFETLLKETGLKIAFGDTTCFNHETETLIISMQQLQEMGFTTVRAFDFAVLHEGYHLRELSEDPEGFQKSIKRYEGTAHATMGFRLHNCTQDIFVNSCIKNECPVYRTSDGDFTNEVKSYYTDHLFKERDFSTMPFAQQFTDYILSLGMGAERGITLSPEVQKIFSDGIIDFSGDQISFKQFIDFHFRPTSSHTPTDKERITRRSLVTHVKLFPILADLMKLDEQAGRKQVPNGGKGIGRARATQDGADEEGQAGPGNLPEDVIKDLIKHFAKKKAEREMTPEERRKQEQAKQIKAAGSAAGIPTQKTEEFINVVEKVRPFVDRLKDAWDEIQTDSSVMHTEVDGPFTRGCSLNLPATIKDFHTVMNNPQGARVQNRRIPHELVREFPVELMIRLVIDCSGSMSEHVSAVEAAVVAIGMSLQAKNLEALEAGIDFSCGLQVVTFQGAGAAKEILPRTHAIRVTDLLKSYGSIHADGGTCDDEALRIVENSLQDIPTEIDPEAKRIDLVIELTDGDTQTEAETRAAIKRLEERCVIMSAIYIDENSGATREHPADTTSSANTSTSSLNISNPAQESLFGKIWGHRGISVEGIEALPHAITHLVDRIKVIMEARDGDAQP